MCKNYSFTRSKADILNMWYFELERCSNWLGSIYEYNVTTWQIIIVIVPIYLLGKIVVVQEIWNYILCFKVRSRNDIKIISRNSTIFQKQFVNNICDSSNFLLNILLSWKMLSLVTNQQHHYYCYSNLNYSLLR